MSVEHNAAKYKIVAVLNKTLEPGTAMNAVAHMGAGLVASASEEIREKMSFIDFPDRNEIVHSSISALSLIVLRGTSNEIRKIRDKVREHNLHFVDFLETMTGDTYKEQLEKTQAVAYGELNFYGIMLFGEKEVIAPITKRQSLWK
ncbi:DUF2000 domain-containing protein [Microcoleus sp. D3_18a_C4]|uniref:DUF2000 domain-containing protein n=1 Tax=unclassified Microcoleus TaxID=2642155 RepID=UPI002FCFD0DD